MTNVCKRMHVTCIFNEFAIIIRKWIWVMKHGGSVQVNFRSKPPLHTCVIIPDSSSSSSPLRALFNLSIFDVHAPFQNTHTTLHSKLGFAKLEVAVCLWDRVYQNNFDPMQKNNRDLSDRALGKINKSLILWPFSGCILDKTAYYFKIESINYSFCWRQFLTAPLRTSTNINHDMPLMTMTSFI